MTRLYFAYGSNLNIGQMLARCPTAEPVRRLTINNWRLVFRDVADIEPSSGHIVHGALYRVSSDDIAALDRYEGIKYGLYRQVQFTIPDTQETAFFYRMNETAIFPPTKLYFETIKQGYADWQLPISPLLLANDASYDTLIDDHFDDLIDELDYPDYADRDDLMAMVNGSWRC